MVRVFNFLITAVLLFSFAAAGLAQQWTEGAAGYVIHLPFLAKDLVYLESLGVLDHSFSGDGWLLTNYSGSLDYGNDIVVQPDGKLLMVGSFDGTSQDFGLARVNSDGSEDITFSQDGRVHTDFFGQSDVANAIALQGDGKIVVAGSAYYNDTARDDFALARYNPDGTLDTSFGGDGMVTTNISGLADLATAVAIQGDGKIVAAGYVYNGSSYDFALARYTPEGNLDPTFSGDGWLTQDFYTKSDRAFALIMDGNALIVAGETYTTSNYDFAMARYNADGSLDVSFGEGGLVHTDFVGGVDKARAVTRQADGKLIVAGYREAGDNTDFALARYGSNGILDSTFGDGGKVTTDFGDDDYGFAIALEPTSGDIVLGGYILNGMQNDFALARYDKNGVLDGDFDDDGKKIADYKGLSEWGYGLVRQNDGKLVLAGYTLTVAGSDFIMARFSDNGVLDVGFNEDGWVITNLFGSNDQATATAVQSDGRLVVAGWVRGIESTDFAVARYSSDGHPDLSFDIDGRLTTDINGDYDYAYTTAVQPDGKIVVAGTAYYVYDDAMALVRYQSDGSLDPAFGIGGRVISDYGQGDDSIHALLIQPDGKLVAAGEVGTDSGQDFVLVRYNSDGSLDTSFGIGGWVVTDFFGDDDHGRALVQQADGKLLVAGYVVNGAEYDFALARYDTFGNLDNTFGGYGRVVTDVSGDDEAHALALLDDGTIVVVGWTDNGTNDDFALVRYKPDGNLDSSFDGDGRVISDISGYDDRLTAIIKQPDNKLVVAGITNPTGMNEDFALARFLPNGSLDVTFSDNGWLTLDFYSGNDGGQSLVMLPSGQLVVVGYGDNGSDLDFALARYR